MADVLAEQLPHCLVLTELPNLGTRYEGKVRDVYRKDDQLVIVASDRFSAFDRVLTTLPFKGQLLNQLASFWFEKTSHVVRNHVIDVPHPNVTVAQACEAFPVEVVVRQYLTGSLWRDYQKGAHRAYGLELPAGMEKDTPFERPIITPSTKAPKGEHDLPISEAEILSSGRVSRWDWERIKEAALALFEEGQRWAASRGLILVDTKYEFGKVRDVLFVIDEIHTPDCSRFWEAGEYVSRIQRGDDQKMLDKENIRQWLIRERGWFGNGPSPEFPDPVRVSAARTYLDAFERIAGSSPDLKLGPAEESIRAALRSR